MKSIIFKRSDKKIKLYAIDYNVSEEDCIFVIEMSDEQTMQLGKLAMDIANSTEIKELSLKLEN